MVTYLDSCVIQKIQLTKFLQLVTEKIDSIISVAIFLGMFACNRHDLVKY